MMPQYSMIANQLHNLARLTLILATLLALNSCVTGMLITKKDYAKLDTTFKATFANKSSALNSNGPDRYLSQTTILDLFEFYKIKADSIHIHFDTLNNMVLSFKDSLGSRKETIHGKFKRHFYYEVFVRKDKVEIPPLLPVIFGRRDTKRLRILLTKQNELLIENKWEQNGNLFLLAGGGFGVYTCYFKQKPKHP